MSKQKASKRPLFWIAGNYYESRKKWNEMLAVFGDAVNLQERECGYAAKDASKYLRPSTMGDIIMDLKNGDMFDDRPRLMRISGCPSDFTVLADYVELLDDRDALVFYGPIGYYVPTGGGYTRFVTVKNTTLFKQMSDWGNVFEFPLEADSNDQAIRWVKRVCSELGREIDHAAVDLLVEYKGRNLDGLFGEITKLIDYSNGKKIELADVESVSIPEFTKTIWDLIENLDYCQYNNSVYHLQKFFDYLSTMPEADAIEEISSLLGALSHHFAFIYMVRSQADKAGKLTFDIAMQAVKDLKKKDKESGVKDIYSFPYVKKNFQSESVQSALAWKTEKILEVVLDTYSCGHLCRISHDLSVIKQILDTFIMFVCNKITRRSAEKIRFRVNKV